MTKKQEEEYYKLYDELVEIVQITSGVLQWYDYDKIKSYGVYIWTKASDPKDMDTWGENLFDIYSSDITFYVEDHVIIEEAWPAIKKIQVQLLKMEEFAKGE